MTGIKTIGVIGAGTMGSGIAQLAASNGYTVYLFDAYDGAVQKGFEKIKNSLEGLVMKGKMTKANAQEVVSRIVITQNLDELSKCDMVIEAIIEELAAKQDLFRKLGDVCKTTCIFATNTSSISVTAIASACKLPGNVLGVHFFNPATIMPLVEIIPGIATAKEVVLQAATLIKSWGKTVVMAKDTPGFIVNRVARPFYGESIRIYEEGIADFATVDWAMKEFGGFRMGPFELMDFIGNDVNYKVTETVWQQFFFDPRYKPSLTQKRLFEAGYWGRKSGQGYYCYEQGVTMPEPLKDEKLGEKIFIRVISMLINEAYEALYYNIATKEDLENAMMKGVNYPKGLLQWGMEIGLEKVYNTIKELQEIYSDGRYRPSLLLKKRPE